MLEGLRLASNKSRRTKAFGTAQPFLDKLDPVDREKLADELRLHGEDAVVCIKSQPVSFRPAATAAFPRFEVCYANPAFCVLFGVQDLLAKELAELELGSFLGPASGQTELARLQVHIQDSDAFKLDSLILYNRTTFMPVHVALRVAPLRDKLGNFAYALLVCQKLPLTRDYVRFLATRNDFAHASPKLVCEERQSAAHSVGVQAQRLLHMLEQNRAVAAQKRAALDRDPLFNEAAQAKLVYFNTKHGKGSYHTVPLRPGMSGVALRHDLREDTSVNPESRFPDGVLRISVSNPFSTAGGDCDDDGRKLAQTVGRRIASQVQARREAQTLMSPVPEAWSNQAALRDSIKLGPTANTQNV